MTALQLILEAASLLQNGDLETARYDVEQALSMLDSELSELYDKELSGFDYE